jgi:uncharacterized protein (TIGR02145 family)
MKRKPWFGFLSSLSIGAVILFIIVFTNFGCSKKDDKNPVKPSSNETITDIDGNTYPIVEIGTQWWMAENLKAARYRNGNAIPNVTDSTAWAALTTGAYCNWGNDAGKAAVYGRLYNWYAVKDSRNIAPAGWHVPSDAEWQTLVDYLGGDAVAGGKMKETGTIHWNSHNTGATNESGFSALPGSYRNGSGPFDDMKGDEAYFWSSSQTDTESAGSWILGSGTSKVTRFSFFSKNYGFSVRCVRD